MLSTQAILSKIKWSKDQLIPVISQDYQTQQVLTLAWMNQDALTLSIETLEATYWSRSRQRLWKKGEVSGHIQKIKDIYLDCDGDTLLISIEQVGGISCHKGHSSCFHQQLVDGEFVLCSQPIKSPEQIYGK